MIRVYEVGWTYGWRATPEDGNIAYMKLVERVGECLV